MQVELSAGDLHPPSLPAKGCCFRPWEFARHRSPCQCTTPAARAMNVEKKVRRYNFCASATRGCPRLRVSVQGSLVSIRAATLAAAWPTQEALPRHHHRGSTGRRGGGVGEWVRDDHKSAPGVVRVYLTFLAASSKPL